MFVILDSDILTLNEGEIHEIPYSDDEDEDEDEEHNNDNALIS